MLIAKSETLSTHCAPISPSIRVCWVDLLVICTRHVASANAIIDGSDAPTILDLRSPYSPRGGVFSFWHSAGNRSTA